MSRLNDPIKRQSEVKVKVKVNFEADLNIRRGPMIDPSEIDRSKVIKYADTGEPRNGSKVRKLAQSKQANGMTEDERNNAYIDAYIEAATQSTLRLAKEWGKEIEGEIPFTTCDDEAINIKLKTINDKFGPLFPLKSSH